MAVAGWVGLTKASFPTLAASSLLWPAPAASPALTYASTLVGALPFAPLASLYLDPLARFDPSIDARANLSLGLNAG